MNANPYSYLAVIAALALSGCVDNDSITTDLCPDNPDKTAPGICGCETADTDTDGDGKPDCIDECPEDADKTEPGMCGCGTADIDSDGDTVPDCHDECPQNNIKSTPGVCGCETADTDTDGDGMQDCIDECPEDIHKTTPGICGCGAEDDDADHDGNPDCIDKCPEDPEKIEPGICGCGFPDTDTDGDGFADCKDGCPEDPQKIDAGACGCGIADTAERLSDSDGDKTINCMDGCPDNPFKIAPGSTSCDGIDTDGDTIEDDSDPCPYNPQISTGDGGDACNITVENGKEIFLIFRPEDLITASQKTAKITVGSPCKKLNSIICADPGKSGQALKCSYVTSNLPYSYKEYQCGSCEIQGDIHVCKGSPATDAHLPGEDCSGGFTPICINDMHSTVCSDEKIIQTAACTHAFSSCAAASGLCEETAPDHSVTTGGDPGAACDPSTYVETCTDTASAKRCIDSHVVETACDYTCESFNINPDYPRRYVSCRSGSDRQIKIRLMADIDLSEISHAAPETGAGVWKPIDLTDVDFDGNQKKIYLKSHPLGNSLFGNVINSDIRNVTLDYDIAGPYAVAHYISDSNIDTVTYTGHIDFKTHDSDDRPAVIAGHIKNSFITDMTINTEIKSSPDSTYVSLIAATIYNTHIDKMTAAVPSAAAEYFQLFANLRTKSSINHSKFDYGTIKIKNINKGSYISPSAQIFNTDFAYKLLQGRSVAGIANTIEGTLHKVTLKADKLQSILSLYAVTSDLLGLINAANISVKSAESSRDDYHTIDVSANGLLKDSTISIDDIKTDSYACGLGTPINGNVKNNTIVIKNIFSSETAHGLAAEISGVLENNTVKIGSIRSEEGSYGIAELMTSAVLKDNTIDIQNIYCSGDVSSSAPASQSFGIGADTGEISGGKITIGRVTGRHEAYGIAKKTKGLLNAKIDISDITAAESAGLAQSIEYIDSSDITVQSAKGKNVHIFDEVNAGIKKSAIHIETADAGEGASFIGLLKGSLDLSSVYIGKMTGRSYAYVIKEAAKMDMHNFSLYSNIYAYKTAENGASFIHTVTDPNPAPIVENTVSSGRVHYYENPDDHTKPALYKKSGHFADIVPPEMQFTANGSAAWLSRGTGCTALSETDSAKENSLKVFTPDTYKDKNAGDVLEQVWITREIKEEDKTFLIPWVDKNRITP